jgi:hypothetical protein
MCWQKQFGPYIITEEAVDRERMRQLAQRPRDQRTLK